MATKNSSSERGQVMILLVIGFIVLLGFAALAIDGGMVYSDRRNAQNGADAASLGGGGVAALTLENNQITYSNFSCSAAGVIDAENAGMDAAVDRADSNDYTIDYDIFDHNGVSTVCGEVFNGAWTEKYIDLTVEISATTQTAFAHLVYSNPLRNNVLAVTRIRPRTPLAYGNAIVSVNKAPCSGNQNGVIVGGNSTVNVTGGGIFSNGCLRGTGGSYSVNVTGGNVSYAGQTSGTMNFSPPETQVPLTLPPASYAVPVPDCSDPAANNVASITLSSGTLTLSPGLYCVSGEVRITGGKFTAEGVTIYLPTGSVTINGNADLSDPGLQAPAADPDPSPAIEGVLFYVAQGDVNLEGNADSKYVGLIYAPKGTIKAHGTSGTYPTFSTQFIGLNVDVSGNTNIDINYSIEKQYTIPAAIDLYR